jgi:hypothetical protein
MTVRDELLSMRATLFETLGHIGDLIDVLRAIAASARLAGRETGPHRRDPDKGRRAARTDDDEQR